MPFVPSSYQKAIFDAVISGRGDIAVNAVAGSGKTTTLVEAAKRVRGTCGAFAFNRNAAANLKTKFTGTNVDVKTINGYGHAALLRELGPLNVDKDKYKKMAKAIVAEKVALPGDMTPNDYVSALITALSRVMSSLMDTNDWEDGVVCDANFAPWDELAASQNVPVAARVDFLNEVVRVANSGQRFAREQKMISYDDQIWLPVIWNLPTRKYDFVMVDEAQDLSKAKFALILKARSRGGRMMFVGDPDQAIYGFAGADHAAWSNMITQLGALELPLSICYRCPKKVVDYVRTELNKPHFEAAATAQPGKVETIREQQLIRMVREGDLILGRMTAPLVKLCLKLIGQRVSARVRGKDIGEQITRTIKDIARRERCSTFAQFPDAMNRYAQKMAALFAEQDNGDRMLADMNDRFDAITICWEQSDEQTLEGLCEEIEALFSEERASVSLSTVHKAKGDEESRVFIIEPDKLPMVWRNQTQAEYTQELNLKYVAVTRAKSELYFVEAA